MRFRARVSDASVATEIKVAWSWSLKELEDALVTQLCGRYPSLWAAIESIAPKIGCVPQTLNEWVKRAEVDAGVREGVTTSEAQRIKDLERENRELRKANEILKLASAFFAQAELDRRIKSCMAPDRPELGHLVSRSPKLSFLTFCKASTYSCLRVKILSANGMLTTRLQRPPPRALVSANE